MFIIQLRKNSAINYGPFNSLEEAEAVDTAEIWGTAHANEFQWYARKVSSPEANSENITFETEYVCD